MSRAARVLALLLACSATIAAAPAAHGAPLPWGDIDTTYGTNGRTELAGLDADVQTGDLEVDGAGQAVLSASQPRTGGSSWLLATLDTAGDPAGPVNALALSSATTSPPLLLRRGTKFLQAGGTGSSWTIVRRQADGTDEASDPGTPFPHVVETFPGVTGVRVRALVEQPVTPTDGSDPYTRLVVVGDGQTASTGGRTLVVGYRPAAAGGLEHDPTFADPATSRLILTAVPTVGGAALTDGTIVIAGYDGAPGQLGNAIRVIRLTATGTVDSGFGTKSHPFIDDTPAGEGTPDTGQIEGIVVDHVGRLILFGNGTGQRPSVYAGSHPGAVVAGGAMRVVRLTATGELDAAFAGDGNRTRQFTYIYGLDGTMNAHAATIDSLNRVTVTGYASNWEGTESHIMLFRLKEDGYDSRPFGALDEQATSVGVGSGEALAFEPMGKLLVGGETSGKVVAQRYIMEETSGTFEPEPVGATVSPNFGSAQVTDVPGHTVDLLIERGPGGVTITERAEGLGLVAGEGPDADNNGTADLCTQVTPEKVTCPSTTEAQLQLDDGSDRVAVAAGSDVAVSGDLGAGNDTATLSAAATASTATSELHAGEGDDTITGGPGRERLWGDEGDDKLDAGATGGDDLYGGDDADVLTAGAGHDRLFGGDGDDDLTAGGGDDVLQGGLGADSIVSGGGDDQVWLTEATSPTRIRAGGGANTGADGMVDIDGDLSNGVVSENDDYAADFESFLGSDDADDVVIPGAPSPASSATSFAGGGDDTVVGTSGDDTIDGGDGHDELRGEGGRDVLYGDRDPDSEDGAPGDDELHGGSGADTLLGGEGSDLLSGGDDSDDLYGEWFTGTVVTALGADRYVADEPGAPGAGTDDRAFLAPTGDQTVTLDGQDDDGRDDEGDNVDPSVELVQTGSGDDTITGTDDAEQFFAGSGNDVVDARGGADTIDGAEGDDSLTGGDGDDVVYGGAGNGADVISGGPGKDALDGMNGDDELTGGTGVDRLYGSLGADVLRARDDEVDQTIDCGDGAADRAILDAADPAGQFCETNERPATGDGGGNPDPQPTTPTPTTPNPTTPVTPDPGSGGGAQSGNGGGAPAPAPDSGPLLCPTRLDLYVRGDVPLGAGQRDGFGIWVNSPASGVRIEASLADLASGAVLAASAPMTTSGDGPTALRFALVGDAAGKLAAADTRVALSASTAVAGCPQVSARDELTVLRDGAGSKASLRGHVRGAIAPTAAPPGRATKAGTFGPAACAIAAGVSIQPGGACYVKPEPKPLPPNPAPACHGQAPLSNPTLKVVGTCLRKDPKTGIYTAYADTSNRFGSVMLNGIKLTPSAGGRITIDPRALQIKASGRATATVGGITLFDGSLNWSLGTKEFTIGQAKGSATLKGFALSGGIKLRFSPRPKTAADAKTPPTPPAGGVVVETNVKIAAPKPPQGGKPANLSAAVAFRVDSTGQIALVDLEVVLPKFSAGPVEILPTTIAYSAKDDTWSGSGSVVLPSPAKPRPTVGLQLRFKAGKLTFGRITASNANLPFGPPPYSAATRLQLIDAAFTWEDALKINGAVGFSVDTPPVAGRSKRIAELILTAGYDFKPPGKWEGSGLVKTFGEELGRGKVGYWNNSGKLSFDASVQRDFGQLFKLGVRGTIKGDFSAGRVTGTGTATVSAGTFSAGGKVTLSASSVVACLDGYEGAGGTYLLETKELKLFEGCGNPSLKDAVRKAKEDYDALKKARDNAKNKGKKSQAEGVISVGQFSVADDLPFVVLAVQGQGGVPQGAFVSPSGARFAAPAPGQSAPVGAGGFAASDPESSRVFVTIKQPAPGIWRWEPAEGSVPLALGLQSDADRDPKLSAKVTGKGNSRTVEYDAELPDGMTVRFQETGDDVFQDLGSARDSGRGEVKFTPAEGLSKPRKIVAVLERDGALVSTKVVASFRASADGRPAKVTDLRVSRSGDDRLRVRFDGADDADGHRVIVRLGDGGQQLLDLDGGARSVLIEGAPRDVSATVTVQGVSDTGLAGPAASKRIAAGKPRTQKLPKVPADGTLGVADVVFAQLQ